MSGRFYGGTIDAGAGDDLIDLVGAIRILGGDGDDTIRVSTGGFALGIEEGSYIDGGDGNDVIESPGDYSQLHGGDGNDTITANWADTAYGGAGDDVMRAWDAGARLFGGDGDDTFLIQHAVGAEPEPCFFACGSNSYDGEAGNDTYEFTLVLERYGADDPPDTIENSFSLPHFVAGEDVFVLDVERPDGEEGRGLLNAEIVQTTTTFRDQSDTYAYLVLTFAGTETEPETTTTIRFFDSNVTMDDIVLRSV